MILAFPNLQTAAKAAGQLQNPTNRSFSILVIRDKILVPHTSYWLNLVTEQEHQFFFP